MSCNHDNPRKQINILRKNGKVIKSTTLVCSDCGVGGVSDFLSYEGDFLNVSASDELKPKYVLDSSLVNINPIGFMFLAYRGWFVFVSGLWAILLGYLWYLNGFSILLIGSLVCLPLVYWLSGRFVLAHARKGSISVDNSKKGNLMAENCLFWAGSPQEHYVGYRLVIFRNDGGKLKSRRELFCINCQEILKDTTILLGELARGVYIDPSAQDISRLRFYAASQKFKMALTAFCIMLTVASAAVSSSDSANYERYFLLSMFFCFFSMFSGFSMVKSYPRALDYSKTTDAVLPVLDIFHRIPELDAKPMEEKRTALYGYLKDYDAYLDNRDVYKDDQFVKNIEARKYLISRMVDDLSDGYDVNIRQSLSKGAVVGARSIEAARNSKKTSRAKTTPGLFEGASKKVSSVFKGATAATPQATVIADEPTKPIEDYLALIDRIIEDYSTKKLDIVYVIENNALFNSRFDTTDAFERMMVRYQIEPPITAKTARDFYTEFQVKWSAAVAFAEAKGTAALSEDAQKKADSVINLYSRMTNSASSDSEKQKSSEMLKKGLNDLRRDGVSVPAVSLDALDTLIRRELTVR